MTRRALCIGINNYPGTQMDLAGCVNDANDWADDSVPRFRRRACSTQATKAAMLGAMREVIGAAAAGDTVVITFPATAPSCPMPAGTRATASTRACARLT
jgi:hypothetical protein